MWCPVGSNGNKRHASCDGSRDGSWRRLRGVCGAVELWGRVEQALVGNEAKYAGYAPALRRFLSTQYGGYVIPRFYNSGGSITFGKNVAWWSDLFSRCSWNCAPGSMMLTVWQAMQDRVSGKTVGGRQAELAAGIPVL